MTLTSGDIEPPGREPKYKIHLYFGMAAVTTSHVDKQNNIDVKYVKRRICVLPIIQPFDILTTMKRSQTASRNCMTVTADASLVQQSHLLYLSCIKYDGSLALCIT